MSAKFSRSLIQRIYEHACAEGWLRAGETVLDPFAGVSLGGLPAALRGIHHIGIELEPRFHALALENVALWQRKYGHLLQWVAPICLQGDSRQLQTILTESATACVSSPPFCNSDGCKGGSNLYVRRRQQTGRDPQSASTSGFSADPYGTHPAQLGNMTPGNIEAAISSPPYANGCTHTGGTDTAPQHIAGGPLAYVAYGQSEGQLGTMPIEPDFTTVVSSPPYEASWHAAESTEKNENRMRLAGYSESYIRQQFRASKAAGGNLNAQEYGKTSGQLGCDAGDTFWAAAKTILEQTHAVLKPGGYAIFVLKAFVRDGQIVDFPAQWRTLCEHVGFRTVHEHHAMLVDAPSAPGLFGEPVEYYRTARKSFFRRLSEQKGSPRIDYETVLCMQK